MIDFVTAYCALSFIARALTFGVRERIVRPNNPMRRDLHKSPPIARVRAGHRFDLRTSELGGSIARQQDRLYCWRLIHARIGADTAPRPRHSLCGPSTPGPFAALFHLTSEAFMLMNRWRRLALLLLTIPVPVFAQGIDFNTRSFQGGPVNEGTVGQLKVRWVYQTVPDTGTTSSAQGSVSSTPAVEGRFLYFND